jgi:hypothetical protein
LLHHLALDFIRQAPARLVKIARDVFIHVALARPRHGVEDPAQKATHSLARNSPGATAMADGTVDIFMYRQNTHGSLHHSEMVERNSLIPSSDADIDRAWLS